MRQIGIDWNRVRECLHVPEDAGEYTEGLRRILLRIPDGWGRWIRASKGWYPIIVRLDEDLAALDPDYQVHQVKEKFGGLKYYFRTEQDELRKAMCALVDAAEAAAELVCEECGDAGSGVRMRTDHYRQQNLCDRCADKRPPDRIRRLN
ncbi:hypothetical protein [Rhodococcus sp. W8901]|uniref:hypothetical protein n=1 Tax=Rhodococcus sp. W8901 TaxID=2742603 RepID=UPI001583D866|nr:hypothetical protein [Rhodococcus sp. W8901]QKT12162.1 hypothetical protein HUN07_16905 [Rhodococcus sp. W8901]